MYDAEKVLADDKREMEQGGTAFPCGSNTGGFVSRGMTLRNYFAAKAMQGILANDVCMREIMAGGDWRVEVANRIAARCVQYADALLDELKKEPK